MSVDYSYLSADEAAEEFYNADDESFREQLVAFGATDPLLAQAFARTRQLYKDKKFARNYTDVG